MNYFIIVFKKSKNFKISAYALIQFKLLHKIINGLF